MRIYCSSKKETVVGAATICTHVSVIHRNGRASNDVSAKQAVTAAPGSKQRANTGAGASKRCNLTDLLSARGRGVTANDAPS
jgi:hypothetical protein